MQIQSVGHSPHFRSKTDEDKSKAIDNFINTDDRKLLEVSRFKANADTDAKRHKKISKALYYSLPVVAGVAVAALTRGNTKLFSKELSGASAKIVNGSKEIAKWGGVMALFEAFNLGRKKITENSKKASDIDRKNPLLSAAIALGLGVATVVAAPKAYTKILKAIKPHHKFVIRKTAIDFAKKFDKLGFVNSISTNVRKGINKIPPSISNLGKSALKWAPIAWAAGIVAHDINHASVNHRETVKNFNGLKDAQLHFAKVRKEDLAVEKEKLEKVIEKSVENEEQFQKTENLLPDLKALDDQFEVRDNEVRAKLEILDQLEDRLDKSSLSHEDKVKLIMKKVEKLGLSEYYTEGLKILNH